MNTPWGQSDFSRKITRGVVLVITPSHGGLGVAFATARKLLSPAALACAEYKSNYYWFEEDCTIAIPFYEQPTWHQTACPTAGEKYFTKEYLEQDIRLGCPKYFEFKNTLTEHLPELHVGQKLTLLQGFMGYPGLMSGSTLFVHGFCGDKVEVQTEIGRLYRLELAFYYGKGYTSSKILKPA
jgi:hypothetical protein